jgi:ferrous iron transport protein B
MGEKNTINLLNNNCANCPVHDKGELKRMGIDSGDSDFVIALAGNPNTGKSTVFNQLTGLRQHTGNWPGKTVSRAEGGFQFGENKYKIVDLPGTYSLLSTSTDEAVARDFILFGKPDVTVIVIDSTRLNRNLNLTLQILEITDRVVVCLNLIDEAKRNGISIDSRLLSKKLGVPVIETAARQGQGINELLKAIDEVANGKYICKPYRLKYPKRILSAIEPLIRELKKEFPDLPNLRWIAMRLLEGDQSIIDFIKQRSEKANEYQEIDFGKGENIIDEEEDIDDILALSSRLRWRLGDNFHDELMESIFEESKKISRITVFREGKKTPFSFDRKLDKIVTSKIWGFPIMLGLLALVFWLTIVGANYPSSFLSSILVDKGHPFLKGLVDSVGFPWWLNGVLIDGAYMAMAWVISVMLPPMAIFFPLFTLLEDFGYLPRVAFNLDKIYQKAGAHGKQALSMSMGFGCNAAGVVATRIIDSPRERLIAIITNNFSLCNGRWPTQILLATIFIGALVPAKWAGLISSSAVIAIALLGIFLSFVVSWLLSRTVLKGAPSAFSLELPPYRPPRILQTIYTSLIDRTLIVLWRAIVFAIPAGIAIWIISNVNINGISLAEYFIDWSDPFAFYLGMNGIILLAFIVAIPANEIVIPTILMLTVLHFGLNGVGAGSGIMFELDSTDATANILKAGGWTTLTAVNLMLFSLLHNPCSTTIYTIYKETGSTKWTLLATFLPIIMGLIVTFIVAQVWYILG